MGTSPLTFSQTQLEALQKYMHMTPELWTIEHALIKKAQKYMKYIAWIPGLKMVAIGNSVALGHATKESDIDLFIITTPNSMWLVRILVTGIFGIFCVRKTGKNHAGKMCLSFFVTTDGLDFSDFALENDIYLYFWCVYLCPLIDYDNTFSQFLHAQNWANFSEYTTQIHTNTTQRITHTGKAKKENFFFNTLNTLLKKIFLPRTQKSYEKLWKPYGIRIGKHILKFHNNDRRQEIQEHIFSKKDK